MTIKRKPGSKKIQATFTQTESVSDFKARIAQRMRPFETPQDKPCVRTPQDKGYFPPPRKLIEKENSVEITAEDLIANIKKTSQVYVLDNYRSSPRKYPTTRDFKYVEGAMLIGASIRMIEGTVKI